MLTKAQVFGFPNTFFYFIVKFLKSNYIHIVDDILLIGI